MAISIDVLLQEMIKRGASDLHITAGLSPNLRIDEKIVPTDFEKLNPEKAKNLIYSMLDSQQIKKFEEEKELDFSFGVEGLSRFRVNVFLQRGYVGAAIRALPFYIMSFEECGLPVETVKDLCRKPKGLVLVTGATGCGKSTTLASMVNWINTERHCHIITVEDPIEYVHQNKNSIVDQREVGCDTHSFAKALRHILREDPDVILIGEMRDLETIEAALNIAETGHLAFATLHTSDSIQTVNRIIDVFPEYKQQQVRTQLSFVLIGVLSQQLIPKTTDKGRVLAAEVLLVNHAVRSLIREKKIHQIYSSIQTGQKEGMMTMNQALCDLYKRNIITYEDAVGRTPEPQDLERMLNKG